MWSFRRSWTPIACSICPWPQKRSKCGRRIAEEVGLHWGRRDGKWMIRMCCWLCHQAQVKLDAALTSSCRKNGFRSHQGFSQTSKSRPQNDQKFINIFQKIIKIRWQMGRCRGLGTDLRPGRWPHQGTRERPGGRCLCFSAALYGDDERGGRSCWLMPYGSIWSMFDWFCSTVEPILYWFDPSRGKRTLVFFLAALQEMRIRPASNRCLFSLLPPWLVPQSFGKVAVTWLGCYVMLCYMMLYDIRYYPLE